ncbi:MAG: GntR family transcriptional regulator [Firmicutes bacterium]|nr:GntR family transcriptional regulator [Bacillota bacterium]
MVKKFMTKTEFAYNEIKDKIGQGIYKIHNLYTIVDVANEIGVSRTPVSGAIKILESEGYVTIYPGVGFRIKDLSLSEIKESLLISGALEIVAMDYIIDSNMISESKKRLCNEYVENSMKAIKTRDGKSYVECADRYHEVLYDMVDLPSVKNILADHTFLHKSLYIEGVNKFPDDANELAIDHLKILEAIIEKNKKKIRDVIEEHELHCYIILEKVLES